MRILALVPARGGSKRLPGKNLLFLGGRPLLSWSIEVAKEIPEVCDILVSTDDPQIAAVARDHAAYVPWLRPAELSTDTAGSADVCIHALDWYESQHGAVDGLLLLQPTSPFRSRATVERGIALFRDQRRSVIGVGAAAHHPLWCFKIEHGCLQPFVEGASVTQRSQDLPPAFAVNGAFYLATPADLRARRSFFGYETVPLVIEPPEESIDIDTEWDFELARVVAAKLVRAGLRGEPA